MSEANEKHSKSTRKLLIFGVLDVLLLRCVGDLHIPNRSCADVQYLEMLYSQETIIIIVSADANARVGKLTTRIAHHPGSPRDTERKSS
jgi:hypothetical protein